MRALVIGGDGFVGRWLIRHLASSGDSVDAVVGHGFEPPLPDAQRIERIDVRDGKALTRFVGESQPTAIYYLAGVSDQGERDQLGAAVGVSVVGGVNTLIAAGAMEQAARILYVSTGYVYAPGEQPASEDEPTAPIGLYAIAKLAGEEILRSLGPHGGVEVVSVRPFNHIGPGQRQTFVVPFVASQIADIAVGRADAVHLRSADQVRDFSDVRDVVRAYRLLMERGVPGAIYNVASGSGIAIGALVDMMLDVAHVSARVEATPAADETADTRIGDPSKVAELGWAREYTLRQTLADVLAMYIEEPAVLPNTH